MKTKTWTTIMLALAGGLSAPAQQPIDFPTPSQIHEQSMADLRGRDEIVQPPGWRPELPTSKLNGDLQRKGLFDTRTPPSPRETPGVVSVDSLRKPVPKKARKAYERATKSRENVELKKAEREYLMAISYFPDYAVAHNDLGALYILLHRYAEAEAEFRRAIELLPRNTVGYSNLGWTLATLGKLAEAEQSARKALELDAGNPQAHLLLGGLLVGFDQTKQEGFKHLEIAAKSLPVARTRLQQLGR